MATIPVMFRFWEGEVTAVFPTMPYDNRRPPLISDIMSYAHTGQHGCAAWSWVALSRPATEIESAPLLHELQRIYHEHTLLVIP